MNHENDTKQDAKSENGSKFLAYKVSKQFVFSGLFFSLVSTEFKLLASNATNKRSAFIHDRD